MSRARSGAFADVATGRAAADRAAAGHAGAGAARAGRADQDQLQGRQPPAPVRRRAAAHAAVCAGLAARRLHAAVRRRAGRIVDRAARGRARHGDRAHAGAGAYLAGAGVRWPLARGGGSARVYRRRQRSLDRGARPSGANGRRRPRAGTGSAGRPLVRALAHADRRRSAQSLQPRADAVGDRPRVGRISDGDGGFAPGHRPARHRPARPAGGVQDAGV